MDLIKPMISFFSHNLYPPIPAYPHTRIKYTAQSIPSLFNGRACASHMRPSPSPFPFLLFVVLLPISEPASIAAKSCLPAATCRSVQKQKNDFTKYLG